MQIKYILFLQILLCSLNSFSQTRNKTIGNYLRIGGLIGFNTSYPEYQYISNESFTDQNTILNFITSTSGTFEVEIDTLIISDITTFKTPLRRFHFGMSFQTINQGGKFHELSIANINSTQFEFTTETSIDHSGIEMPIRRLRTQTTDIFQLNVRYEYGSFLRDVQSKKFNIAISAFVKPEFNSIKITSSEIISTELVSNEFIIFLGVGATLNFKISKRLILGIKAYPSKEVYNSSNVKRIGANISSKGGEFERIKNPSEINLEGMLSLKYAIKVPYKKGKRMRF